MTTHTNTPFAAMSGLTNLPLYIAVRIENCETRAREWLTLPLTKEQFSAALTRIGAENCRYAVTSYWSTVPLIDPHTLMRTPLSAANHLAARLNKLTSKEIVKLCAVTDRTDAIGAVARMIEFTYHTDDITLLDGVMNLEALGNARLSGLSAGALTDAVKRCVNLGEFGASVAELEDGYCTPWGYITSKRKWDFYRSVPRLVPSALNLKGSIGEDLYGVIDEGDFDYGKI